VARNLICLGTIQEIGAIQMYESDDRSSEEWDDFLHTQADIGDYYLYQEAFEYRPTQQEMQMLALQGRALLFIDSLKRK
jgi:hypothetical protein